MVNMKILLSATAIAMLTLSVGVAWADEVTSAINYQGQLADSSGSPLSGTYTMTFRLYEAATGGTALATDVHDVVVTDGLFNTEIDFDQSYFDGRELWLGITVGTDSEMTPRQEFRPVPYALSLVPGARIVGAAQLPLTAETTHLSGRAIRGYATSTSGTSYGVEGASYSPDGYGGYFYNNGGGVGVYGKGEYGGYFDGKVYVSDSVGIGTTNPSGKLHVNGDLHLSGSSKDISWQTGQNLQFGEWNGSTFAERMRIASGGNVGIGTTSPAQPLDVNGDIEIGGGSSNWDGGSESIKLRGQSQNWYVGVQNAETGEESDLYIGLSSSGGILHVENTGNIGIGTTKPDTKLHISGGSDATNGSGSGYLVLGSVTGENLVIDNNEIMARKNGTESTLYLQNEGGDLVTHLWKEEGSRFVIKDSGNVGIGTTFPVAKLHVNADSGQRAIRVSGGSTIDGASLSSKWNLPTTPSGDATLSVISASSAGLGFIVGNNVASPVVWMYDYGSRNAFTVARKGYSDTGEDISDIDDYLTPLFQVRQNGNVGIGTTSPREKLTVRGNVLIESENTGMAVVELGEGLDYAEGFDVSDKTEIGPGTVLIIDPDNPGKLTLSNTPYDTKVAGIVAGANETGSGVRLGADQFDYDVALAGRVYCNVDATEEGVEPGDMLTTSATPGYAMKSTDYTRAHGAILGKAMQRMEKGQKEQILVLVTLQ